MNINKPNCVPPFSIIPTDSISEIFSHLNPREFATVRKTCQLFSKIPPTVELIESNKPQRKMFSKKFIDHYWNPEGKLKNKTDLNEYFKALVQHKRSACEELERCIVEFKDANLSVINLLQAGAEPNKNHFRLALKNNSKEILGFLVEYGYTPTNDDFDFALRENSMHCYDLYFKYKVRPSIRLLDLAIRNKCQSIILDNLLERGAIPTSESVDNALKKDYESGIIKQCLDGGALPSSESLTIALKKRYDWSVVDRLLCAGSQPSADFLDIVLGIGGFSDDYGRTIVSAVTQGAIPTPDSIDLILSGIRTLSNEIKNSRPEFYVSEISTKKSKIETYIKIIYFFVELGVRPNPKAFTEAIKWNLDVKIIKLLFNRDTIIGSYTISTAVIHHCDDETLIFLLNNLSVRPSTLDLNNAIKYKCSDEVIKLFLQRDASPNLETLKILDDRLSSYEASSSSLSSKTIKQIRDYGSSFVNRKQRRTAPHCQSHSPLAIKQRYTILGLDNKYDSETLTSSDLEEEMLTYIGRKRVRDDFESDLPSNKRAKFS